MQVRDGWSAEYARKKFDVSLEEDDWERFVAEKNIDEPVPLVYKFRIMQLQAAVLSLAVLVEYHQHLGEAKQAAEAASEQSERQEALDKLLEVVTSPAGS